MMVSVIKFSKLWLAVLVIMSSMPARAEVNPLNIDELILKATQTHPLVNAARADEVAAEEGVKAAKLSLWATPTVGASHDSEDGLISTVTIRQPLWTGGKLTADINRSIYDQKAATAYIFDQQNTVAKNTIDVWRGYVYAIALQELYTSNLERLREFEAMMQRRVDQGVSAKIELDLVKNRILQDYNSYQGALEQERVAGARLAQLVGENLGTKKYNITLKMLTDYAKTQSVNFETLVFGNSGATHPSVVRQFYQVESAKQEVKSQTASRYPTVYAQYQHTFKLEKQSDSGDFSVGMSYDPGAGFSNMALARASEARAQSLVQTQEAARRNVMEGLQTQYQEFISSKDKERSLLSAIEGAQIVVDSYGRQFIAGRKTWLEVLNAVRELSDYQRQLLEVQAQMVASFYKLQVDFGAMPWQKDHQVLFEPITEFRPYRSFKDWTQSQKGRIRPFKDLPTDSVPPPTEPAPEWQLDESAFVSDDELTDSDIDGGEGIASEELTDSEKSSDTSTKKPVK
jgi:adhesin transport system outer membrane protein